MSTTKQITLWCDGTDNGHSCGAWIQTEGLEPATRAAIRARGKRGGWSTNGPLDYCPRHLRVAHLSADPSPVMCTHDGGEWPDLSTCADCGATLKPDEWEQATP